MGDDNDHLDFVSSQADDERFHEEEEEDESVAELGCHPSTEDLINGNSQSVLFLSSQLFGLSNENQGQETVWLMPLTHQVGGHGLFFKCRLDSYNAKDTCAQGSLEPKPCHLDIVLKIFRRQECLFYERVHKLHLSLLPFLAVYYGIAKLAYTPSNLVFVDQERQKSQTDCSSYSEKGENTDALENPSDQNFKVIGSSGETITRASLLAIPNVKFETFSVPHADTNTDKSPVRDNSKDLAEIEESVIEQPHAPVSRIMLPNYESADKESYLSNSKNSNSNSPVPTTPVYHPWSRALLYKDKKRESMTQSGTSTPQEMESLESKQETFLLLEDLTSNMKNPCIVDIKMGKRHYGLYTSAEKRRRQNEKSSKTTSASLAIRLCGMQVYKENIKKYTFMSKYEGRKLSNLEQITEALAYFLHNGTILHRGLIPMLLDELRKLHNLMRTDLVHFRMYASSLLILYDGYSPKSIRVKQIDFEHCYAEQDASLYEKFDGLEYQAGPDREYLEGLENLILIFEQIYARPHLSDIGNTEE
jgi:hypothetical protein